LLSFRENRVFVYVHQVTDRQTNRRTALSHKAPAIARGD